MTKKPKRRKKNRSLRVPPTKRVAEDRLNALLTEGYLSVRANFISLALDKFEAALRLDDGNPFIMIEMAKCHQKLHNASALKGILGKLKRLSAGDSIVGLKFGEALDYLRMPRLAVDEFKRAARDSNVRSMAIASAARTCERMGDVTQGAELLDTLSREEQRHPSARLARAYILFRKKEFDQARVILEGIGKLSENDATKSAGYLLAIVLDRMGQYDDAYAVLERIKRKIASTDQAKASRKSFLAGQKNLQAVLDKTTSETFQRWVDSCPIDEASYRLAFLLGHPRSGTTLLEQTLDAHRELVSIDETGEFFRAAWLPLIDRKRECDGDFYRAIDEVKSATLQKYMAEYHKGIDFEISDGGATSWQADVVLDKNPGLTDKMLAIVRIFPQAHLLVALRDPRDVCISAFMQPVGVTAWSVNWLTIESTVGMYKTAMEQWLQLRETIPLNYLEVRYEDTVKDVEATGKKATEFLGLHWQPSQAEPDRHARSKNVFSPTYGDVQQPVYTRAIARWKNYEKYLEPHLAVLRPFVEAFGYD